MEIFSHSYVILHSFSKIRSFSTLNLDDNKDSNISCSQSAVLPISSDNKLNPSRPLVLNETSYFTQTVMSKLDENLRNATIGDFKLNFSEDIGGQLRARNSLIFLLENLPPSSPLREFILNIVELEYLVQGKDIKNKLNIVDKSNEVKWADIEKKILNPLKREECLIAGTYLFSQEITGELYIGSSINLNVRIREHLQRMVRKTSVRSLFPLYKTQRTQYDSLYFSIIHRLPNFLTIWTSNHLEPLTFAEEVLLRLLTLYPVLILEQSLQNNYKPSINGWNIVNHKFTRLPSNPYSIKYSYEYMTKKK